MLIGGGPAGCCWITITCGCGAGCIGIIWTAGCIITGCGCCIIIGCANTLAINYDAAATFEVEARDPAFPDAAWNAVTDASARSMARRFRAPVRTALAADLITRVLSVWLLE